VDGGGTDCSYKYIYEVCTSMSCNPVVMMKMKVTVQAQRSSLPGCQSALSVRDR